MLLKDFISGSSKDLESLYGSEEARSVVMLLCSELLGTKNYTHIVDPGYQIEKNRLPALEAAMARLRDGEPVQYVLGYSDFYGYRFHTDPSVLIPRPETEQLCKMAIEEASRRKRMRSAFGDNEVRVLDLCTGSGCIAWTMALSVPGTEVTAVDVSEKALETASSQDFKAEIKKAGAMRPVFRCCDVLTQDFSADGWEKDGWNGGFDIIISNPPYVRESEKALMRRNVCDYEPGLALFVPDEDPLVFYRAIASWAEAVLVPGGAGFVEINEAFGDETAAVFSGRGFSNVSVVNDFCSKNRFVRFTK